MLKKKDKGKDKYKKYRCVKGVNMWNSSIRALNKYKTLYVKKV